MNVYLCFWEEQLQQTLNLWCSNLITASFGYGDEFCREPGTTRCAGATCPAHKEPLTSHRRFPIWFVPGAEGWPFLGYIKQNVWPPGAHTGLGNYNIFSFSHFCFGTVMDKLLARLTSWFRIRGRKLDAGSFVLIFKKVLRIISCIFCFWSKQTGKVLLQFYTQIYAGHLVGRGKNSFSLWG